MFPGGWLKVVVEVAEWALEDLALAEGLLAVADDVVADLLLASQVRVRLHVLPHLCEVHLVKHLVSEGGWFERTVYGFGNGPLAEISRSIVRIYKELQVATHMFISCDLISS